MLYLLFVTLLCFSHVHSQGNGKGKGKGNNTPNFIIFMADDLGYADLGVTGSATIRTPNLDKVFTQGARLNSYYSQPLCSPSRASFLTGRLPVRNGVYTSFTFPLDGFHRIFFPTSVGCLPEEELTLPTVLGGSGYETVMIGKWHLGHQNATGHSCLPLDRGFKEWIGLPYSHEEGFPHPVAGIIFPPVPLYEGHTMIEQPANFTTLSTRYNERILNKLDIFAENKKPFFIHYSFDQPHYPTFTAPEYTGKSLRGPYGDAVEEIDASVGLVLAKLKETGLDKNTIIFFASDNGAWPEPGVGLPGYPTFPLQGGSNGLLRDGKGSTYEGGVRVVAAWYWPRRIPPSISMGITSVHDIFPTVLDFAGIPMPTNRIFDGHSLVPLLTGENKTSPHLFNYYYRESMLMAIRYGPWKCHFWTRSGFDGEPPIQQNPCVLYNVEWNPSENYPINVTQVPGVVALLTQEYQKQLTTVVRGVPQYNILSNSSMPCCNGGPLTDEAIQQARDLGLVLLPMWQYLGCVC